MCSWVTAFATSEALAWPPELGRLNEGPDLDRFHPLRRNWAWSDGSRLGRPPLCQAEASNPDGDLPMVIGLLMVVDHSPVL